MGMFSILGLSECKISVSLRFKLIELVNAVFGEQSSVVLANVGVPACSI